MAIKNAQGQPGQEQHATSSGPIRPAPMRKSYAPYGDGNSHSQPHSQSSQSRPPVPSRFAAPLSSAPIPSVALHTPSVDGPGEAFESHPTNSTMHHTSTPRSPFSSFALTPGALRSNHDNGGLSWLDSISMLDGGASIFGTGLDFGFDNMGAHGSTQFPSEQAQLLSLESPETMIASGSSGPGTLANLLPSHRREPQLEDVTSWANISHYISLYLQYLYPILPLVHRPTFAENLATRLDLRDTDFRALLLSIVAFTISQMPTSRLTTEQFDVEGLKRLQRRCHRMSQLLQHTYHGQVTLTQICIIILWVSLC